MNNFEKRISKSVIIELFKKNVIPKLILKVLEKPEKSTSLAFFLEKSFNEGLNEVSTKVNYCFNVKLKELNYVKFNEVTKFSNPKYRQR